MLSDTHPQAQKVLIELFRKATVAQRADRAFSMSATVKELSMRAIARANPNDSEQEIKLKWAELHYGKDLADRVREYIRARESDAMRKGGK